jgi:hypothetical protein
LFELLSIFDSPYFSQLPLASIASFILCHTDSLTIPVATLTEATNRVQEKRQQQLQHKKPLHLATPQASAAAGSSSEAHIKMAAAFASAAAAGALSDGGGLYTRDDVGSESSESGAKSGGGVGAGNKQLSPSEDFNKVRRKEAAAKTASEKGLVQGGHHWGVSKEKGGLCRRQKTRKRKQTEQSVRLGGGSLVIFS